MARGWWDPICCLMAAGAPPVLCTHRTGQQTRRTPASFKISLLFIFFAFWITNTLAATSLGFHPHPREHSTLSPSSAEQVNNNNKKSPARSLRMGPDAYFEGVAENWVVAVLASRSQTEKEAYKGEKWAKKYLAILPLPKEQEDKEKIVI